jgi:hypothetical protein
VTPYHRSKTLPFDSNTPNIKANRSLKAGLIFTDDLIDKELIIRFSSDLTSNKLFYIDENGRELIKRNRDHRVFGQISIKLSQ